MYFRLSMGDFPACHSLVFWGCSHFEKKTCDRTPLRPQPEVDMVDGSEELKVGADSDVTHLSTEPL